MRLRQSYALFLLLFLFSSALNQIRAEDKAELKAIHLHSYNDFEHNPHINSFMRKKIRPYLLPESHSIKPILDTIFLHSRPTTNPHTFAKAGFVTLHVQPRSFIRVARHPFLPGYLFKVYLDSELRQKHNRPGWEWLVNRCKGACQVRKALKKISSKYFQVAQKWLYPLPADPSPPIKGHIWQPVVLVVQDMNIREDKVSRYAWKHLITKAHLDELYDIIKIGGGSRYRPDNVCYSKNGKLCFIDTEYPGIEKDFTYSRKYFSHEMRLYWDEIVHKKHSSH